MSASRDYKMASMKGVSDRRRCIEQGLLHSSCSSSFCIWWCSSTPAPSPPASGGAVVVHQHFCKLVLLLRVRSPCALNALQSAVLLFLPHPPPPTPATPTTTPAAVVQWWLLQSCCISSLPEQHKVFLTHKQHWHDGTVGN